MSCVQIILVILSGIIFIIAVVILGDGYSPIYGGYRNHESEYWTVVAHNNPSHYLTSGHICSNGKQRVLVSAFNMTTYTVNPRKCYSDKYLQDHFPIGKSIDIYYDAAALNPCVTPDYAAETALIGFVILIIGCAIVVCLCLECIFKKLNNKEWPPGGLRFESHDFYRPPSPLTQIDDDDIEHHHNNHEHHHNNHEHHHNNHEHHHNNHEHHQP